MSQERDKPAIRRILVALDASPASLTALETAAELAGALQAELAGIFVEDINLVRVTAIAFTQEVGLFSATRRQLSALSIERQLRAQAGRARQALAAVAQRAQLDWSFHVARGVVASELLEAASRADLVILGRAGGQPGARRRLGSTAQTILTRTPRLTLLIQPGSRLELPVLSIYDGSTVARRALAIVAQLMAGRQNGYVTILLVADSPARVQQLQQEAAEQLAGGDLAVRYIWQSRISPQSLAQTVQIEGCRILVVPSNGSALDRDAVVTLLNRIECPVLLVR